MSSLYAQFLTYDPASLEYRLLVTLCLGVVVLFGLSLLFVLITMLLRLQNVRQELRWAKLQQLWSNDLLDVLSGDRSPEDFRRLVAPRHGLDFVRFLAPYAYRLRGSDLGILSQLALHYLPHVAKLLKHREAGVRVWAVNILSLFGMPSYEDRMLEALQDESPMVSMFAANTLLRLKRLQYVEPVMNHFHRFDKWNLNSMATLLSGIGEQAIPVLRQIYQDETRPSRTRVVASEVLNLFSDYGVADAAAALLTAGADQDLVIATLRLLGRVGQSHHREIVRRFCNAPVEAIRVNAMRALRQLCTTEDRPLLVAALDDSSPWVAREAARALKLLGDTDTLERLVREQHPRAMLARQVLAGKD